jgi:hypothetical protein
VNVTNGAVIGAVCAAVGGPLGLWLLQRWRPGAKEKADVAVSVASAFQKLVDGLEAENARHMAMIKSLRDDATAQRNRLVKLQGYVRAVDQILDHHIADLEHRLAAAGVDFPHRPELPPLPDLT